MIFNESFWSALAFVLLFVFVGRAVLSLVRVALDKRADKIKSDIEEAARLREEAQAFLNTCKRQYHEAKEQAKEIILHAEQESERLQKEAFIHINDLKIVEERALQERIVIAERQAILDIERRAVEISMVAAEKVIREAMTPEKDQIYFDAFIEHVKTASFHL